MSPDQAPLDDSALLVVAAWALAEGLGRGQRWLPAAACALLLGLLGWRGFEVGFLPLTNKYESFLTFTTVLLAVATLRYSRLGRPGRILLALTAGGFLGAALAFDSAIHYPSPLLYTAWYAAHVPLSFAGYAFWVAAAADGLDGLLGVTEPADLARWQDADVRLGFVFFSLSMVFGAVWGVVSWGAYFLWDAKIVWSLAAWLYFATFAHLRLWPVRAARPRAVLGGLGLAIVLITYVGTSFMKGSIHSF